MAITSLYFVVVLSALIVVALFVSVDSQPTLTPSPPTSSSSSSSCLDGLTAFSIDDDVSAATLLDLSLECFYDTESLGEAQTYYFVDPTTPSQVRIEPGETVAFYSTPPDVYQVTSSADGSRLSLVHRPLSLQSAGDDAVLPPPPPLPPSAFALTVTFPPSQLQSLRIGGSSMGRSNIVIAPGFVNLREINATLSLGELNAILTPSGPLLLRLRGEAFGGVRVAVVAATTTVAATDVATESEGGTATNDATSNSTTSNTTNTTTNNNSNYSSPAQLFLDVENGAGDIEIHSNVTIAGGRVDAINIPFRNGTVFIDATIADNDDDDDDDTGIALLEYTGRGPGQLYVRNCTDVIVQGNNNCTELEDDQTLDKPVLDCVVTPGCLARATSEIDPADGGAGSAPLLSCSVSNTLECAAPTVMPSMASSITASPTLMPTEEADNNGGPTSATVSSRIHVVAIQWWNVALAGTVLVGLLFFV